MVDVMKTGSSTHSVFSDAFGAGSQRCRSPTDGFHECMFCHKTTAEVLSRGWRELHPPDTNLNSCYTPEQHPLSSNKNFSWCLLFWICKPCRKSWCSYKYYIAVEDGLTPKDFTPPPQSTFKDLPSLPASDAATPEHETTPPFPTRTSSLAHCTWASSQSTLFNHSYTEQEFYMNNGLSIPTNCSIVPISGAANAASAALAQDVLSQSPFFGPSDTTKHSSAPESLFQQMPLLEYEISTRPNSENFGLIPPDVPRKHKRGENFDPDNYTRIRRCGACPDCKTKRRRCDPSHPRPDTRFAPTPS